VVNAVGQADVLAGQDHQPPGDEPRVLPCLEHPRQVVQRGVGIGATQRLDERRDDVVVLVALPVVADRRPVDRRLGRGQVDHRAAGGPGRAGGRLEIGQRATGVAAGQPDQVVAGVVIEGERAAEAALVDQGALDDVGDVGVGERVQLQQEAAGEQRGDHREERVLGRGRDQGDPAVLDSGQEGVLLGLAEAVHLVDEQHRLAAPMGQVGARLLDRGPHLLDAGRHGRDLHEGTVGGAAHDRGDGGLARARRPPQQQRQGLAALDQLTQR
jgi:hypothetical protein